MFWFTCIALTLIVVGFVVAPLLRSVDTHAANPDVALYKAQLTEVDKDLERGLLAPEEAERTRTEVARRLLSASKEDASQTTTPPATSRVLAIATVAAALTVSLAAYLTIGKPGEPDQPLADRLALAQDLYANRPSQAQFEAEAPAPPPVDAPQDYLDSVDQLRDLMPTRPDDLRGWQLLVRHETSLLNYSAASAAQTQVLRLSGGGNLDEKVRQLDLMVAAANGQVSPEAEALARQILQQDESNIPARYYIGAMHNIVGRPDIAFRLWRPMVEAGPNSFHASLARGQIEAAAWRAGVAYSLPEIRGPSAADMAAAEDMSAEDRAQMIGGMVTGLANRLAVEGGPASDWARLIRAYGVLGETEAASEIWLEAQTAFANDPDAIATLRDAARSAGVAE